MAARSQLKITLLLALITTQMCSLGASDWLADGWRVEDGLPDNVVNAIAQTPDGFLWLGTQGGLASFDGVRFNLVDDDRFDIQRIQHLYVDRAGRLWVIGEQGEVALIHEGQIKTFTGKDGLPRHGLQAPVEDAKGRLWLSAREDQGCFYFDGTRFVSAAATNGPVRGQFRQLAFDNDGTLYGERADELWALFPNGPERVTLPPGMVGGSQVMHASREGGFWLMAGNQCFMRRGGQWQKIGQLPYELPANLETFTSYEDGQGRLWFATLQRPRPISFTTNGVVVEQDFNARTGMSCRTLFEDREGNRWWATGNDGLRRFRPRPVTLVGNVENAPASFVYAVAADPQGGIWASIGRGLIRVTNTASLEPQLLNRLPYARSLWIENDQTVWIGCEINGLFRFQGGSSDNFREERNPQAQQPFLTTVFRKSQGNLLVGSTEGLFRLNSESKSLVKDSDPVSSHFDFRALAQDSRGNVYAGLRNGGLLKSIDDKWAQVTNGLPGDDVAALYFDGDDALWIAVTGHGLCRLAEGKIFSFQSARVRLPRNICGIMEDKLGFLWLASTEGIFEISREDLNAIADGRADDAAVRQFDRYDGMISSQCVTGQQPVVTRSTDGKLWFATTRGLCVIDPTLIRRSSRPPPVALEYVSVDNQIAWSRPLNSTFATTNVVRLSPDNAILEFRFTALSLTAPHHNRFRFQLAGLNHDWVDSGTEQNVYYTRVPPGHYQFKVMACGQEGVWSEALNTLAVIVLPHWWQTLWFRSSAIVGFCLVLLGMYCWRARGLAREQNAQLKFSRQLIESQEQERQRISAELHDSLGQSLLVVKNYAVMALRESTPPEKIREKVREISEAATASIEEVRSIARALRPYQLDRFGLTKTLEDTAELVAKTSNLKVEAAVANVDQTFSPDAEISIYRIVQEWLNNVSKHSQASVARLVVRREAGWAHLIMEDNGIGFDYAAVKNRPRANTGVGLDNLNERVRLLEGILKIETSPGNGARLCVDIPYQK